MKMLFNFNKNLMEHKGLLRKSAQKLKGDKQKLQDNRC
jgi:hypothetical protein